MAETSLCGRVGCGDPAACVLLMATQECHAWLVGTDHDFSAEGVALCATHADRITVPLGWTLTDERPPARSKARKPRKKRAPAKTVPSETEAGDADETVSSEPGRARARSKGKAPPEAEAEPAPSERQPGESGDEVLALPDVADPPTGGDEPTVELPAATAETSPRPAEAPLNAGATAAALQETSRPLSVVPGEDDPDKTFGFEHDGQGALWAPGAQDTREPDETTPLLKRAFRVVRDD